MWVPQPLMVVEVRLVADAWEAWRDIGGHDDREFLAGYQRRRIERTTAFLRAVAEGRVVPPGLFSDKR